MMMLMTMVVVTRSIEGMGRKAKLERRRLRVRPFASFVRFARCNGTVTRKKEKGGGEGDEKNAIEALRIRTNCWKHLLGECEGAALYSQLVSFLRIMAERAILLHFCRVEGGGGGG